MSFEISQFQGKWTWHIWCLADWELYFSCMILEDPERSLEGGKFHFASWHCKYFDWILYHDSLRQSKISIFCQFSLVFLLLLLLKLWFKLRTWEDCDVIFLTGHFYFFRQGLLYIGFRLIFTLVAEVNCIPFLDLFGGYEIVYFRQVLGMALWFS